MTTQWSRDLFGYEVVEGHQVVTAFDGPPGAPRDLGYRQAGLEDLDFVGERLRLAWIRELATLSS